MFQDTEQLDSLPERMVRPISVYMRVKPLTANERKDLKVKIGAN